MNQSSILGGTSASLQADGKDVDTLGPSDTSDSDTDASGTGERASADGQAPIDGADILPDRIIEDLDEIGDDWDDNAVSGERDSDSAR